MGDMQWGKNGGEWGIAMPMHAYSMSPEKGGNLPLFPPPAYATGHCSLFRTVRSETCPWGVAILLTVSS